MVTKEDLESYLIRLGTDHEEIADGMYLARGGAERLPIVVDHAPPLALLRLKVMDLPAEPGRLEPLFRLLLELNAGDVVHGAYGLEGDELVLTHALELDGLDFSRFQTAFESLLMAAGGHLGRIRSLVAPGGEG